MQKKSRQGWSLTRELYDPNELAAEYVRGQREMLGPLHRWAPAETMSWLEAMGVALQTDAQLGVRPVDGIEAVRSTLAAALLQAGVKVITGTTVSAADAKHTGGFWLTMENGETVECHALVLASGGLLANRTLAICRAFGHTVVELAPSIFDLHTRDRRILRASGLHLDGVALQDDSGARAEGTVYLEPWGLGGPAIGALTARAAESMRDRQYRFELRVDWIGACPDANQRTIEAIQRTHPGRRLGEAEAAPVPIRLWRQMLAAAHTEPDQAWSRLSKSEARALHRQLRHDTVKIIKRGAHEQETAICGGVALSEVDFRDLQSRHVPGLFFAGGILDIDALPGGANLQACWTTGQIAGTGAAAM